MEPARTRRGPALRRLIAVELLVLLVALAWRWRTHPVSPPMRMAEFSSPLDPSGWRPSTPDERARASASIQAQLDAFKADNYERAITYESHALRESVAVPSFLRHMIRGSYPEFADYRSVEFGAARSDRPGSHLTILVTLTGEDGKTVQALYGMVIEENAYRVDGVLGGHSEPPAPGIDA